MRLQILHLKRMVVVFSSLVAMLAASMVISDAAGEQGESHSSRQQSVRQPTALPVVDPPPVDPTVSPVFRSTSSMVTLTSPDRPSAHPAVNLRTAGSFAVLTKTGITDVFASTIRGNVGASPITGSAIGLMCPEVTETIFSVDVGPCRFIFQVAGTLTQAAAKKVILTGGAQARNVFWQTAGAVTIGTTAHSEGTILSKTMIALNTGASTNGRLLAQTQVTLQKNVVTIAR